MSVILCISPHPDDETLGCGATLLKHRDRGDIIYWLILTNALVTEGFSADFVESRQQEINLVAGIYGFKRVFKLNLPTTKLDVIPKAELVNQIFEVVEKIKPQELYLPFDNDIHSDHRVSADVSISAVKSFRCPFVKKILMTEIISETEFAPAGLHSRFIPNSFSDVTNYLEKKIKIMRIYKGEMANHPFPRSVKNIKALATFRGSIAGVRYAEAFMIVKEIW